MRIKIIVAAIVTVFVLVFATGAVMYVALHRSEPPHNLAADSLHAAVPGAACTPGYQDEGATHAHSVTCLVNNVPIYLQIDTANGLTFKRLGEQQPEQQTPATPAPAAQPQPGSGSAGVKP